MDASFPLGTEAYKKIRKFKVSLRNVPPAEIYKNGTFIKLFKIFFFHI